ncbi:hypothetical protein J2S74_001919 [Evansella vedderi]|uniref:DUF8042 domain-containing protein n=1 Tax=Evansella vedderi TaxID=38282 RepID=A0ABT9ZUB9_9BACI|nr:hypothetical protein [Evansella vedderi]MDQ0254540.1 hypothetical protein [Evansella vedderi]
MSEMKLTEAQHQFLVQYLGLLNEVESTIQFVGECYLQGDADIGDRLLKDIMTSLAPFNRDNMTVYSIFGSDDLALKTLDKFQASVDISINVEERFSRIWDRATFLNDTLAPSLQSWRQIIKKYLEIKQAD